jgi:hypothetical protein
MSCPAGGIDPVSVAVSGGLAEVLDVDGTANMPVHLARA